MDGEIIEENSPGTKEFGGCKFGIKPFPRFPAICYLSGMEKRMVQLESLVALQEKTLSELDQEIFRQQQDIARLRRRLDDLEEKLDEARNPEEIAGSERPPHY